MTTHIVFFKLKEPTQANKKALSDKLMSMQGKIDELKSIETGCNFATKEGAFDVSLITRFDTPAALEVYATHPVHLEVVEYVKQVISDAKVVDYQA